ncbi:Nucleolus and neural progenitor protein [Frankliniella fusca]|uniref:Nucleolus and neural progenitor protein n=1 Tax=Frankliniella fusca TaxID=407009 RepID=A0AAE1LS23_9NEOP|nr:Nucleolus and neural progenitor protein [Frankliniella fusca]
MGTPLWNDFDLKPPPTFTSKLASSEISHSSLRKLSDVLWDALTLLQNQQALSTEAATLSRLIYRMKNLFHGDKGFKTIEKINHCLRHYLSLNLVSMFDNFFRTIPWDCSEKEIYCPTKQMLEYILLRTQGLSALLCRIVHTCLEGAFLFKSRMSSGHHWHVSLLCLGVISRIWAIAKHLFESCVKWYNAMLPFLKVFQPSGPVWLAEGYIFPPDLTKWLDVSWAETNVSAYENASNLSENSGICLLYDDDDDVDDNDVKAEEEVSPLSSHITPKIQSINDDVGVSISRSTYPISSTSQVNEGKSCEAEDDTQKFPIHEEKSVERQPKAKKRKLNKLSFKNEKDCKKTILDNESEVTEQVINSCLSVGNVNSKKVSKGVLPSLMSQSDVENFLNSEMKKRSVTSSLDDQQWALLKKLVSKLNVKLKKTQKENKKQQILEQIKKAFTIALS